MSATLEAPPAPPDEELQPAADGGGILLEPLPGPAIGGLEEGERPVPLLTTLGASALASVAAGWMVSGVFRGFLPHLVALGGVAIGTLVIGLSYRQRRDFIQYLVIPIACLAGLGLIVPFANGGSANAPQLVVEAIRAGGLAQPPVAFDPGWRFILIVVITLLAAAAASMAVSTNRPKLGVLIPLPVAAAAGLVQPASTEIVSAVVAAVCMAGGLVLAEGAELARHGELTAGFETRRILRGGGMVLALAVVLVVLSRTGFLFPEPIRNQVIPPQRPQVPPPTPDRPLFYVKAPNNLKLPYRLGVIDGYTYDPQTKDGAWLLPSYDPDRFKKLSKQSGFKGYPDYPTSSKKSITLTFRIADATGHQVPDIAQMEAINGIDVASEFDPLTDSIRLTDQRVFRGLTYTVTAASPPTASELEQAGSPPKSMSTFLKVPPPPGEVLKILNDAPENKFDRLFAVRKALLDKVVAAGAGKPVDVAPQRVVDMLNGGEATPYEITAAEALLARWAGVPSRIGYGYYGGIQQKDGSLEVRPKHGSTWLEVYFSGYGWVPITGNPQQAKASTTGSSTTEPNIKPSKNFALLVYVPMREATFLQYYDYVRYYSLVAAPFILLLVAAVILYPGLLKLIRKRIRRRWGAANGYFGRITVAYAEFRDVCVDLTVGDPGATPLEFLAYLDPDPEHHELAWLVTRAWWGDLRRDLREDDAHAAEVLSASLVRRFTAAQTPLNRALAVSARASLVHPYSEDIPNFWIRTPISGLAAAIRRRLTPRRAAPGRRLAKLGTT